MKHIIFLTSLMAIGTSCIEDAQEPLPYQKQYLIVGYSVKDYFGDASGSPKDVTFVQIFNSSPAEKREVSYVTDAKVVLKAKSMDKETSYILAYQENEPEDSDIHNYFSGYFSDDKLSYNVTYWLEVTIENETFISNQYVLAKTGNNYTLSDEGDQLSGRKTIYVDQANDHRNSFFAQNSRLPYLNFYRAINYAKFYDQRYMNSNRQSIEYFLGSYKFVLIEIPLNVDYFFTALESSIMKLENDAFNQLFSSPPASLPCEFHYSSGGLADSKVKGLYFPTNGLILSE